MEPWAADPGSVGRLSPNPDVCDVYWGSHGCDLPRGHDDWHWCDCCTGPNHSEQNSGCVGAYPYYGVGKFRFAGADVRPCDHAIEGLTVNGGGDDD